VAKSAVSLTTLSKTTDFARCVARGQSPRQAIIATIASLLVKKNSPRFQNFGGNYPTKNAAFVAAPFFQRVLALSIAPKLVKTERIQSE
jgi:hypothetical protein